MLPLWLVYALIILLLLADVLLFIGLGLAGLFLIGTLAFGAFAGFIEKMIDQLIKDVLGHLRRYIKAHSGPASSHASALVDVVEEIYKIVLWLYNLFQLATGGAIVLINIALLLLGAAALAAVNIILAWLVYVYFL